MNPPWEKHYYHLCPPRFLANTPTCSRHRRPRRPHSEAWWCKWPIGAYRRRPEVSPNFVPSRTWQRWINSTLSRFDCPSTSIITPRTTMNKQKQSSSCLDVACRRRVPSWRQLLRPFSQAAQDRRPVAIDSPKSHNEVRLREELVEE
jgi:hypothetical protein